jgi:hypothetical protein
MNRMNPRMNLASCKNPRDSGMPPATRRAVREATSLLTATPSEVALLVAAALDNARDLLCLAVACRRFALKCIAAPRGAPAPGASSGAARVVAAQQVEMWSIAEEMARRWIASCTDQERGWVPRRGRESWLGLMWEVESLRRRGVVFGRSHGSITLSEGGAVATRSGQSAYTCAASKAVMRAGHHYAQFTAMSGTIMFFGVIRPGWDVEGGQHAEKAIKHGHCFYYTGDGRRCPGYRDWEGVQGAREDGDRIGMLLDLDQGSMTVYKNDERLGVMATGLSGEYSWVVSLFRQGAGARIEAAAIPAPAAALA